MKSFHTETPAMTTIEARMSIRVAVVQQATKPYFAVTTVSKSAGPTPTPSNHPRATHHIPDTLSSVQVMLAMSNE
jgi:hypothetical protein